MRKQCSNCKFLHFDCPIPTNECISHQYSAWKKYETDQFIIDDTDEALLLAVGELSIKRYTKE